MHKISYDESGLYADVLSFSKSEIPALKGVAVIFSLSD